MAYCDDINQFGRWRYPWHWAVNKHNDGKHGDCCNHLSETLSQGA